MHPTVKEENFRQRNLNYKQVSKICRENYKKNHKLPY